jgi:hypothetical protein
MQKNTSKKMLIRFCLFSLKQILGDGAHAQVILTLGPDFWQIISMK